MINLSAIDSTEITCFNQIAVRCSSCVYMYMVFITFVAIWFCIKKKVLKVNARKYNGINTNFIRKYYGINTDFVHTFQEKKSIYCFMKNVNVLNLSRSFRRLNTCHLYQGKYYKIVFRNNVTKNLSYLFNKFKALK